MHFDSTVARWLLPGPEALNPPGSLTAVFPWSPRATPGPRSRVDGTIHRIISLSLRTAKRPTSSAFLSHVEKSNTPVTSICTCCFYSFLSLINLLKIKVSIFNQSKCICEMHIERLISRRYVFRISHRFKQRN